MKVKVDKELCIGCGVCVNICPDLFELNDDNVAEALTSEVEANLEADVKEAADSCPVDAIIIEE